MLKRYICGPFFLSVLSMLFPCATSRGQDSKSLPDLGVEMTYRANGDLRVPLTPEMAARGEVVRQDHVQPLYIMPLRWQLEKRQVYQDLIRDELASIAEERDQATAEQEQLANELMSFGVATLEQLDEKHRQLQKVKLEAAVLEAECDALHEAVKQREESIAKQSPEKYDEAISLQEKLVQLAEKKRQELEQLHKQGATQANRLAEANAEVIRARRELALMDVEAVPQTDPILDTLLSRLAEVEPQRKAAAAKAENLSSLTENAGQIRRLIHERRQVDQKLDLLTERANQLKMRLREERLRAEYVQAILERYESSLKKAAGSSQEDG